MRCLYYPQKRTSVSHADRTVVTVQQGASAPEIEVMPAMIEAGVAVLWNSGRLETFMDGIDQLLVQKIFVAMSLVPKERS